MCDIICVCRIYKTSNFKHDFASLKINILSHRKPYIFPTIYLCAKFHLNPFSRTGVIE